METSCVGSESRSVLIERYPEIGFLLNYTSFDSSFEKEADIERKAQMEDVDVLYVFGVGQGKTYPAYRSWLKARRGRLIIYIEDSLSAIQGLLESEGSSELLSDPQVHLEFVQDLKSLNLTLKALVETYPSHRIEVISTSAYRKERGALFKRIRLKLMRESAVVNALMTEALYSHRLVENVLANIKRWPRSFFANRLKNRFKGIPAVICGAGPSLKSSLPLLRQLEDKALIIAGGSTIAALSNQGIVPHLGLALDPNAEEYSRLRVSSAFEMPLLYGTRVQPDVFSTCSGPWGYLHSFTGGPCEAYFERELEIQADPVGPDLGPEAFSVTTMAIALAVEMGCSPIFLNGIDLAYTGMQRYAPGVMPSSSVDVQDLKEETRASERLLKRKGIQGSMVYTLVKWVMESSSIANYAKAHPEAQFFNVSSAGLGFKGIANIPFSEAVQQHCKGSWDLRAMVHHCAEQNRFEKISPTAISDQMQVILESLKRLQKICVEMLQELKRLKDPIDGRDLPLPTGKMTILQLDFEEEKAFDCFLPHVGPALDRLLNRSHAIPFELDSQEIRLKMLDRLSTKWEHIQTMVEKEIEILYHWRKVNS